MKRTLLALAVVVLSLVTAQLAEAQALTRSQVIGQASQQANAARTALTAAQQQQANLVAAMVNYGASSWQASYERTVLGERTQEYANNAAAAWESLDYAASSAFGPLSWGQDLIDYSAVSDRLGIMQYEVQPILGDLNGGNGTTAAPDFDDGDMGGGEDDYDAASGDPYDPLGDKPKWYDDFEDTGP